MNTVDNTAALNKVFDEATKGKRFPLGLMTVLLIIGALLGYAHNTTPAPFFASLFDFYAVDPVTGATAMNMTMTIIYPTTIVASFLGSSLVDRLGTRNIFTMCMVFMAVGVLGTFISSTLTIFLVFRAIYGIGFGFSIPAMGSAIMNYYRPKARNFMSTLNGVYPLAGALIAYLVGPIVGGYAGWQMGVGYTGFIILAALIIWIVAVRKDVDSINLANEESKFLGTLESTQEKGVFGFLLKNRDVKCIMVAFACDFTMYAYVATILPYWLMVTGGMTEAEAGVWAAVAFPVFGVIGTIVGGVITNALGKRKPVILICQIVKFVGIMMAALLCDKSVTFIILGVALFGLGNGGWMPPMFIIPTELPGTNAARTAGGFSLFLSTGYIFGFVMPIVGGLLTTYFGVRYGLSGAADAASADAQVAFGYKWSYFILGLSHVIAIIAAIALKETGPGRVKKVKAAE